jgi:hypothetical protein
MALRFSPQLDVCCGSIAQNNSLAFFGLKDPERKKNKEAKQRLLLHLPDFIIIIFLIF